MSLVDQFLADDNEELNQYTQPIQQYKVDDDLEGSQNNQQTASVSRKQMLQDFKKKYNFYNDSSSEDDDEDSSEDHHRPPNKQNYADEVESLDPQSDQQEVEEEVKEEDHQDNESNITDQDYHVQEASNAQQRPQRKNKYSFSSSDNDDVDDGEKVTKFNQCYKEDNDKHIESYDNGNNDNSEDEEEKHHHEETKSRQMSQKTISQTTNSLKNASIKTKTNNYVIEKESDSEDEDNQKAQKSLNKKQLSNNSDEEDDYDRFHQNLKMDQKQSSLNKENLRNQDSNMSSQRFKNKSIDQDDEDEENGSELDFYQLSDVDTSNLLHSSVKKKKRSENNFTEDDASPKNSILKSSIAKVASLLDSQIQNYDKLLSSSQNSDRSLQSSSYPKGQQLQHATAKPETEMTFGDLTSEDQDDQHYQQPLKLQKQPASFKSQKPIHQSIIKEEEEEESSIMNHNESLNYSSHSFANSNLMQSNLLSQRTQYQQQQKSTFYAQDDPKQQHSNNEQGLLLNKGFALRLLIDKFETKRALQTFNKWKEFQLREFYGVKLKNAAMMVDKMSKFSRSFISLNSLSQIIAKNRQRLAAKSFIQWTKQTYSTNNNNKQPQQTAVNDQQTIIDQLKAKLDQKDQEIMRMEQMFKEYSNWKNKLEQIEQKMKSEVDYYKNTCDKLQKENEKLQKEAIKVSQQLMERNKELEAKEVTIDQLQKKIKNNSKSSVPLDPVEEVLCPNCKNSLEESQLYTGRLSRGGGYNTQNTSPDQKPSYDYQLIQDMNDKLTDLERQISIYRERVHYHESIEEELKKNIESQVDVVLKMEEERLLMLKENKEMKDKNKNLVFENDEYKNKIELFEKELGELQDQIREQQLLSQQLQQEREKQLNNTTNQTQDLDESSDTTQSSKLTVNKENKNVNIKKKPGISSNTSSIMKGKTKKQTSLKFQTSSGSKVGENSAIFSSSLKQAIQKEEDNNKSKYGVEPINKTLVQDNQLLTNELVMMGREISKLKAELKQAHDSLKKSEKEKYECKKNLEGKDTAVEKLRKERDELWAIVNTDKYRNIKIIEQEKEKLERVKNDLENQIPLLKEQIQSQSQDNQKLELRIQELEFQNTRLKEKDMSREKLLEVLEEKSRKFEKELSLNEQLSSTTKQEVEALRSENQKLKKDVDWLANSAKNNKLQAERAISDLEAYTKILRGMEKKLAEVEIEKETKEAELRELKSKIFMTNQMPLTNTGIVGNHINNGQWSNVQGMPQQPMQQQMPQQYNPNMLMHQQQQWPQQQQQQHIMPQAVPRQGIPQPHQHPQRF